MKIAAYEVRRDEQKDFAFIAEKRGVELTETEDNLTLENIDTVNGAEGVTTLGRTRFDRALLTAVRERGVKYISTRTIGADHIDLTAAKELGLKVCNSNYAPNGVADYTVMLMLLSLRKYKPALWRAQVNDYSLAGLQGRELRNLTVGILGTGKIGAAVIKNLSGFGCRILASDIRENPSLKGLCTYVDNETLYKECDIISLHMPLLESTRHFVNAETIAKMKDGVRVLNYARGELVNDDDMIAALESGKVAYYCTDFPNAKTCNAKHIIATPHLGASTPESEDNCASMAADELMAYLEQGDIRNSVNLPNAQLQAVYTKVCIIHRNVPAMISALTSVIGVAGANIENMTNASKKDYAYTILDIDGVTDGMIKALTAIDGVLRVRVIEK